MKNILLAAVLAITASCAMQPAIAGETSLPVKLDLSTVPAFGVNLPLPEVVNQPSYHFRDQVEPPAPGSVWSASYLYRLTGEPGDRAAAGAQNRLKTFTNVLGRGWSLDLDAFAGLTLQRAAPVTAFLVGTRKKLANEVEGYLGGGFAVTQGQPSSLVVGAGITVRF